MQNTRQRKQTSATGTRTRVARVRAEYPNQLDYSGAGNRRAPVVDNGTVRKAPDHHSQGCAASFARAPVQAERAESQARQGAHKRDHPVGQTDAATARLAQPAEGKALNLVVVGSRSHGGCIDNRWGRRKLHELLLKTPKRQNVNLRHPARQIAWAAGQQLHNPSSCPSLTCACTSNSA